MEALKQFKIAVLFFNSCFAFFASARKAMNRDELIQLVQEKVQSGGIKNPADLLRFLPTNNKTKIVVVYDSRSALAPFIDESNPRLIVMDRFARINIAVSLSLHPENRAIEISDFESGKNKPLLIELSSKAKEAPKIFLDPIHELPANHPNQCSRCHGVDFKLIADEYPSWPGWLGSNTTRFTEQERHALRELLTRQKDPNLLSIPAMRKIFQRGKTLARDEEDQILVQWEVNNADVHSAMAKQNTLRIFSRLLINSDLKNAPDLYRAALSSESEFESHLNATELRDYHQQRGEQLNEIVAGRKKHANLIAKRLGFPEDTQSSDFTSLDGVENSALARLSYLLRRKGGQNSPDWSMSRESGSFAIRISNRSLTNDLKTMITDAKPLKNNLQTKLTDHNYPRKPEGSKKVIGHLRHDKELLFCKTSSIQARKERSAKLVRDLDGIFALYKNKTLSISETMDKLRAPKLLFNSGYILVETSPALVVLSGIPTLQNRPEWAPLDWLQGSAIRPKNRDARYPSIRKEWNQPGIIYFHPIGVQNGYSLYAPENILLAQENLIALAEELYHAAQALADPGNFERGENIMLENAISTFFRSSLNNREFFKIADVDTTESDVYAKLLEVLGPDAVSDHAAYEARYIGRSFVAKNIDHFCEKKILASDKH